jgi:hypothetical protein
MSTLEGRGSALAQSSRKLVNSGRREVICNCSFVLNRKREVFFFCKLKNWCWEERAYLYRIEIGDFGGVRRRERRGSSLAAGRARWQEAIVVASLSKKHSGQAG